MKLQARALVALVCSLAFAPGCNSLQAKSSFKDGNKSYKEENFRKAIEQYGRAVELDPSMTEAYFYLGSSHQALFRPGKDTPENKARLDDAIKYYNEALSRNDGSTPELKALKMNTLGALTGIYSDEPFSDYDKAYGFAEQLVKENPNDPKNLFAMGNLYEKFEKIDKAEETYKRVFEINPRDPKACGALAAFYNKAYWDKKSRFDDAISTLEQCAALAPEDAGGFQKVATFYWDKAFRDASLNDSQKDRYADKGLEAVDKALSIKPDYFEAIIYKGLLYRVKAQATGDMRKRLEYVNKAQELQKQGMELKKASAALEASAKS
jgi:tetratricopeptide (TPR) repeat protein